MNDDPAEWLRRLQKRYQRNVEITNIGIFVAAVILLMTVVWTLLYLGVK
jgi:hypothetical protein